MTLLKDIKAALDTAAITSFTGDGPKSQVEEHEKSSNRTRLNTALCVPSSVSPEILNGPAQRRIGDTNKAELWMLGRVAVEVTLQSR
ncbi:hypothetical protein [Phyllobacterium sophorae]|uniref:hypothetical protein n=1 Tax=Phyllobacterium sophorae TaxID=1520277 RepID=UPI0011B26A84|nr:hypothetical protein [Phyllobacterium sophorae]